MIKNQFRLKPYRFLSLPFYLVAAFSTTTVFCGENSQGKDSKEEYEYYMGLAQEVNPEAYEKLRECEAITGQHCLKIDKISSIKDGSERTHGYPTIIFKPWKDSDDREFQKTILNIWLKNYNVIPQITPEERQKIIELIKSIDPTLYEAITAVDPMGIDHIKTSYCGGPTIIPSFTDGLPTISIDHITAKFPDNELRMTLGHELGHYVLGHFFEKEHQFSHCTLGTKESISGEFKKDKRVQEQLLFDKTFENAYERIREQEADASAVLDFGISVDDAIAEYRRFSLLKNEEKLSRPERETFKRTHPLWKARIKHLEELRHEVEIRTLRGEELPHFNWKKLAHDYLEKYKDKYKK